MVENISCVSVVLGLIKDKYNVDEFIELVELESIGDDNNAKVGGNIAK
ncbi:14230_t:CDS:1, partial [Gigaspora margarita]